MRLATDSSISSLPLLRHLAQVYLQNLRIILDLPRLALGNGFPEIEDQKPFADIHDQMHLVFDQEDRQLETLP